jgi:hypothetical protein
MVFALETQHGKPHQWGGTSRNADRAGQHRDRVNFRSTDYRGGPMPGYCDYAKLPGT